MTPPVHERLATRRNSAGIPLREMARTLNISHPYLLDMERGFRPMSWEMKARYEAALAKHKPSAGLKNKR